MLPPVNDEYITADSLIPFDIKQMWLRKFILNKFRNLITIDSIESIIEDIDNLSMKLNKIKEIGCFEVVRDFYV